MFCDVYIETTLMMYGHGNQCIISRAQKADTLMIWSSFQTCSVLERLYWLFVAIVSAELLYKTKCINAPNPTLHPAEVVNMMGQVWSRMLWHQFIPSCIRHWRFSDLFCFHLSRTCAMHFIFYILRLFMSYSSSSVSSLLTWCVCRMLSVVYVVSHSW